MILVPPPRSRDLSRSRMQHQRQHQHLIGRLDAFHAAAAAAQRAMFRVIVQADRAEVWAGRGSPGHGPLARDPVRDLRVEGSPVDRRGARARVVAVPVRRVLARRGQDRRAGAVRDARDRGRFDHVGRARVLRVRRAARSIVRSGAASTRSATPRGRARSPGGTSTKVVGSASRRSCPRPRARSSRERWSG
jgi:hypothetical protein